LRGEDVHSEGSLVNLRVMSVWHALAIPIPPPMIYPARRRAKPPSESHVPGSIERAQQNEQI